MRTNTIALQAAAFAAALLSVSAARAETSPLGLWIDHTGRGAVEITQCGDKLCGHVAWLKDAANAEACGEQILGDLKPVGGGVWDHGWIYDPDAESKYDVELTPLGPDKLRVVGYAGTKFLSETMTWRRAPADLPKCSKSSASAPAAKDKPGGRRRHSRQAGVGDEGGERGRYGKAGEQDHGQSRQQDRRSGRDRQGSGH